MNFLNLSQFLEQKGAASLLMDVNTGEILSLISLPDYNLNTRKDIKDKSFTNKITKGVFELGSIFKTFTIALALEDNSFSPNTLVKNIPDKIQCSKFTIKEHDEMPNTLSLKEILIRSSNIGTIKVARSIGENKLKKFLENLNLLNTINFELHEVGKPLSFLWNKCKLETVSYGHGITTTPLQAASAYASISNGGFIVNPTLLLKKDLLNDKTRIVSSKTSKNINSILREVVSNQTGTASLAEVDGYQVGGKTGTANKNINGKYTNNKLTSFISVFPTNKPKFLLLVLIDEPKPAPDLIYNYRGKKISGISRNRSGWNSAYVAGKIIKKIGPILAINKNDFYDNHVVKNLINNLDPKIANERVKGISSDSRKVKKGDLFISIKGNKLDGNSFIKDAISRGAKAVVYSETIKKKYPNIILIKVTDPRSKLAEISSKFYQKKPKNIVAVTGTNGKTSVSDFFYQILKLFKKPVGMIGTLGFKKKIIILGKRELTTSDTIGLHRDLNEMKNSKIENVILEASSHGLKQKD